MIHYNAETNQTRYTPPENPPLQLLSGMPSYAFKAKHVDSRKGNKPNSKQEPKPHGNTRPMQPRLCSYCRESFVPKTQREVCCSQKCCTLRHGKHTKETSNAKPE